MLLLLLAVLLLTTMMCGSAVTGKVGFDAVGVGAIPNSFSCSLTIPDSPTPRLSFGLSTTPIRPPLDSHEPTEIRFCAPPKTFHNVAANNNVHSIAILLKKKT